MCTSVFIETETPNAVFFSSGGARGGFGEMTIFKQRFYRWNFFFVNGLYYNMAYILGSWKLGFWELGAKLFVFQEVYETLLYLLSPFVLPISIIVRPAFFGYLFAGTFVLYFLNVMIFNELHLRLKKERVGSTCLYLYYMPYKVVLTLVNVGSCYWSLYKYAQYFARRHPKIVEDEKAVDVVLRMEEQHDTLADQGRRMTITAVGAQTQGSVVEQTPSGPTERKMTVTALGPKLDIQPMSPVAEQPEVFTPAIRLQGERVSFTSLRSNNSSVKIERLPSQTSEGISPSQHPEATLIRTTTAEKADARSLERHSSRGRRSGSIRSDSLRRSTSLPRSQTSADFASPGFEELMDRLAVIESRLNPRTVSAVEVSIAEETVPISAPEIRFPVYALPIDEEEEEKEEEGYELYDLEKLDSGKTEESKSMV
ncbi:glycosyl transferase, partial [Aureobasidium melanogenum]